MYVKKNNLANINHLNKIHVFSIFLWFFYGSPHVPCLLGLGEAPDLIQASEVRPHHGILMGIDHGIDLMGYLIGYRYKRII
jgi:hypothetical protein